LADEIDQYDEPEAALHFLLYAQNENAKAAQGDKGIPAGTIRYAKKPHKVSFDSFEQDPPFIANTALTTARTTSRIEISSRVWSGESPGQHAARIHSEWSTRGTGQPSKSSPNRQRHHGEA
jgi:hypothetical protein